MRALVSWRGLNGQEWQTVHFTTTGIYDRRSVTILIKCAGALAFRFLLQSLVVVVLV